jgi:hypothetical protein
MTGCGSCGLRNSFGKRRRGRRTAEDISVKSRRGRKSRRSTRRGRKNKRSSRRGRKNKRSSRRGRKSKRSSRRGRKSRRGRSRRFGIVAGPGYKGQTSYSNAFAPYFSSFEPFEVASEWWAPNVNGQIQYPQLAKLAGRNMGPGN